MLAAMPRPHSPPTVSRQALLAYEYVITLDQEVALFWKPKITGATVLFMGTRYSALLSNNVLLATSFAQMSDQVRDTTSESHATTGTDLKFRRAEVCLLT